MSYAQGREISKWSTGKSHCQHSSHLLGGNSWARKQTRRFYDLASNEEATFDRCSEIIKFRFQVLNCLGETAYFICDVMEIMTSTTILPTQWLYNIQHQSGSINRQGKQSEAGVKKLKVRKEMGNIKGSADDHTKRACVSDQYLCFDLLLGTYGMIIFTIWTIHVTLANTIKCSPCNVCKHCPVLISQILTVESAFPETRILSLSSIPLVNDWWPVNVWMQFPVSTSQTLIEVSREPLTTWIPSN